MPMRDMNDTRDIVIRTAANVENLTLELRQFIKESREHRARQDGRLSEHQALVNKVKGVRWLALGLAPLFGYLASYIPHPKL